MTANHYQWKGILQSGEKTGGIIDAPSMELAKTELRKRGIITRKIAVKRKFLFTRFDQRIKSSDINLFSRQLATLFNAGVPLSQSLDIMRTGVSNPRMKALIQIIRTDVETGLMLSQALGKHCRFFNPLFCNMVYAGEQSGSLDVILPNIARYREKITSIKKKIHKAMAYPLAVVCVAILVTAGLLIHVVPQFDLLFKSFDAELPLLTRYVIHLSAFFKTWWFFIIFMSVGMIFGGLHAHRHFPEVSKINHRVILKLPVIGRIVQKALITRFTRTLSIAFAAGLPLTEALKSIAGVIGTGPYAQAAYNIHKEISQGQSLQCAIRNTQLFPDMVIQLISIGEESGTLEQMLDKIADFYEEDVDTAMDALGGLLEPVIMTILGVLIGCLVIAMYLPILKLGSIV